MRLVAAILCLFVASSALGAPTLEATRRAVESAREETRRLRQTKLQQTNELSALAGRIEQLKVRRGRRLLSDESDLQAALRRSHELSSSLTALAQSLSGAEAALEQHHRSLLAALSEELRAVRARLDQATALGDDERRTLYARLRALRSERDAVRAALPQGGPASAPLSEPSEDPVDLLEQADALRDNQDKVRRELARLARRISEVRDERELDGRMSDFLERDFALDRDERTSRALGARGELQTKSANGSPGGNAQADPPAPTREEATPAAGGAGGAGSGSGNDPGSAVGGGGAGTGTGTGTGTGSGSSLGGDGPPADAVSRVPASRVIPLDELRPSGPAGSSLGAPGALSGSDDLEALEREQRRLGGLARELAERAKRLEQRAKRLQDP